MDITTILFYVFSGILLVSSFRVITARSTVHELSIRTNAGEELHFSMRDAHVEVREGHDVSVLASPSRAGAQSEGLWSLERDGWKARTQTRLEMQPDGEAFTVIAELNAFEGEEPFFARRWERRIPRKLL